MKKWLIILSILIVPGFTALAQTDEPTPQEAKIEKRMREYIQDRLNMTRGEAERFTPVFIRYFREFAIAHRMFKGDRLILQQKIIELRLRYRVEFRQIMDEQRANRVFKCEDEFRQEVVRMLRERNLDRPAQRGRRAIQ
jgi:hypothetical protein